MEQSEDVCACICTYIGTPIEGPFSFFLKSSKSDTELAGWPYKKFILSKEYKQRLYGHEFEQTLGDSEGLSRLVYCSSWGCKVLFAV